MTSAPANPIAPITTGLRPAADVALEQRVRQTLMPLAPGPLSWREMPRLETSTPILPTTPAEPTPATTPKAPATPPRSVLL